MTLTIALTPSILNQLDLSPALQVLQSFHDREELLRYEQQLTFSIDYPREPTDPRELSEVPEVRLWFIRLDSLYPWLPFLLNWKAGELGRYTAMLVPHQFHRNEGVQYNPEALEIFVMQKIFVLSTWFKTHEIEGVSRLKGMTKMLGYELDSAFFELL
jgi:hypothetical protein